MKVKMLTLSAGPLGARAAGEVVEVSEAEGRALLAGHYAERVKESEAETAVRERGETPEPPPAPAARRGAGQPAEQPPDAGPRTLPGTGAADAAETPRDRRPRR